MFTARMTRFSEVLILLPVYLFIQCTQHSSETAKTGINIGDVAPDLVYPDPEGNMLSLYSLKGKMVLIDFWASWCPPCRKENPKLVKTYLEYSGKKFNNGDGFTIFSVSCDRTKDEWLKAVENDSLIWKNHVSDLKGWEAEATYKYRISAIPSNFLIDGNGIILAKNIPGDSLAYYLQSMLLKE